MTAPLPPDEPHRQPPPHQPASPSSAPQALLVVGDVVTDVVARYGEPLAADTDTVARIAMRAGGAGGNVACWAARRGARVRLLAKVGADSAGWHRDALVAAGVEPVLRVDDEPTGVVIALVDAAAERTFLTDSGASFRLGPADWEDALLDGVGHVHLSGYLFFSTPGRELAALVTKAARARGLPVSVDPASAGFLLRLGVPDFLDAVAGMDLLLPNAAEATLLAGPEDPESAAAALSARCTGCTVVVTLGAGGALAAVDGEVAARAAAVLARAVDSTGAGDAFTGGLLAARLAGADLPEALAAGCRAGAEAVAVIGGRPDEGRAQGDRPERS